MIINGGADDVINLMTDVFRRELLTELIIRRCEAKGGAQRIAGAACAEYVLISAPSQPHE